MILINNEPEHFIVIKRILLPLDTSPYTDSAMKFAAKIAKHHNAEITGLVILDIPGIEKSVSPVPLGAIYYTEQPDQEKKKEAELHIKQLLDKFKKFCSEKGIRHKEAQLQGSPSDRILAESIYYDAVVMGLRTFFHFETSDKPGDSLIKLLDNSVTPIYAVPQIYDMPSPDEKKLKILLTISDFLPSARAIQRFVQVATPDTVEVCLIAEVKDENSAEFNLNQAELYLQSHGFEVLKKEWTDRKLSDHIDEFYIGKVDILVIGNDVKKGLFSVSVNEVIKNMIKLNRVPLLIG
ncbi:MAG: universal stress protein [Rhodothermaceae bacterium]